MRARQTGGGGGGEKEDGRKEEEEKSVKPYVTEPGDRKRKTDKEKVKRRSQVTHSTYTYVANYRPLLHLVTQLTICLSKITECTKP